MRWGRRWGVLLAILLVLPLVAWSVSWIVHGWIPQGDEGWIALKVHDVFSAHPPIQGMRSTSDGSWPGVWAHHPGPMEFYLLAVPYAAVGYHPAALVVGCLLLTTGLMLIALWHAWQAGRRAGVTAVVIAIVVSEVLLGPSLVLPWNPWPPVIGVVALLVLVWRLLLGHAEALPWFGGVCSLVLQANLAMVAVLLPLLLVLAGVGVVRWHRARGALWPLPGWRPRGRRAVWRRPGVVATALTLACWAPSIAELFMVSPNNASQLCAIAAHELRGPMHLIGAVLLVAACGWAARTIAIRPVLSVRESVRWVSGLITVGTVLSIVAGGIGRLIYLVMMIGGMSFAIAVWPRWGTVVRRVRVVPPPVWAVVGLSIALLIGPGGPGALIFTTLELQGVQLAQPVPQEVVRALRAHGVRTGPVVVHADGLRAAGSYQTAVMVQLTVDGYTLYFDSAWPRPEDDTYRRIRHAPADVVNVTVSDGKPPLVKVPTKPRMSGD